jgi:radical SAM/Cys-rich protein
MAEPVRTSLEGQGESTGRFAEKIAAYSPHFRKTAIEVLQVNVGKYCNLACSHCHVEAGPHRKEAMNARTVEAVLRFLDRSGIPKLDLTGGAPELNPHFEYLVREGRRLGRRVMDRCNLTVFFEPGCDDLPEFLARHEVEIIASLPCYSKDNVDRQRGDGVFEGSIAALRWLNRLGYGREGTGRTLHLVYNPVGAHLPPEQKELEDEYRERLWEDFEIVFNRLYTITNMPITRYAKYLRARGEYEAYVNLLVESFNPTTLNAVMCRNTLSVGWDGTLYDCDFNQMLGLAFPRRTVFDVTREDLAGREIRTADHCFGCTAGCGSSCEGAIS